MVGDLRIPVFLTLYYFWPVFLIGAGVSLMFRKYPFVQTLVFLVQILLFILLAIYIGGGGDVNLTNTPSRTISDKQELVLPEGAELSVDYDILFAKGRVDSGDTELYLIETEDKNLSASYDADSRSVRVSGDQIGVIAFPGNRSTKVQLSDRYEWDIQLDGAFSQVEADLSKLKLNSLNSEAAFCSTAIRLPEPVGTVTVVLDSGFTSTEVFLPLGTPISISVDKGLAQAAYGPTDLKDGVYQLNGFSQAVDRYEIKVDVGFGSVNFEEY
jgi:hypothetical protein